MASNVAIGTNDRAPYTVPVTPFPILLAGAQGMTQDVENEPRDSLKGNPVMVSRGRSPVMVFGTNPTINVNPAPLIRKT